MYEAWKIAHARSVPVSSKVFRCLGIPLWKIVEWTEARVLSSFQVQIPEADLMLGFIREKQAFMHKWAPFQPRYERHLEHRLCRVPDEVYKEIYTLLRDKNQALNRYDWKLVVLLKVGAGNLTSQGNHWKAKGVRTPSLPITEYRCLLKGDPIDD